MTMPSTSSKPGETMPAPLRPDGQPCEGMTEEPLSFWDRIAADERLAATRAKLSFHEFRMILKHARASWPMGDAPSPAIEAGDTPERLANRMGATFVKRPDGQKAAIARAEPQP